MKRKIQKRILGVLAVVLLLAGVVYAAKGYQEDSGFHPFSTNRELRNDQLLLPDEGDSAKSEQETDSDDSFWKDDQAEDDSKDSGADSGYLFQQTAQTPDEQPGNAALEENVTPADDAQGGDTAVPTTDVILDVRTNPGDAGDAGVVIPGTARPGSDKSDSSQNGTKSDSSSDKNDSTTPGKGQGTSDSDKNTGGNTNNNGNTTPSTPDNDKPSTPDTPNTPDTPSKPNYADTAKDPENTKGAPGDILWDSELNPISPDAPEPDGIFVQLFIQQASSGTMYAGQTVSEKTVYCALDTYILELDQDDPFFGTQKIYYWGEDNYGKDKLFYISGVSFDGGETYETAFPMTIPKDIEYGQMKVRVQYRYDTEKDWTEMTVDYEPSATRVYVLSQALEEEHQTIDAETVLNDGKTAPSEGSTVNLYDYQTQLLTDTGEQLLQLFPGWTENGERVPFLYTVTSGRHILEPEELVDYDTDTYDVEYRSYELQDDGTFVQPDPTNWWATRCSLQTLVNYNSSEAREAHELAIPDGVQAVDFDGTVPRMMTDWLELPDSVVYVNSAGTALTVAKGYRVGEDNQNYSSEEGLLYNKEKTAILGVPSDMETLTIPENVTSVTLPENNSIETIILEGNSESYEGLDYDLLADGTKFVLDRESFGDFLTTKRSLLTERNFRVAVSDRPELTFVVHDGFLLTENGCVYTILNQVENSLYLCDHVTGIDRDALEEHESVMNIVLPQNGSLVEVDSELFEKSNVDHVFCYSKQQYDAVKKQATEDVTVSLLMQTKDGFTYFLDGDGAVLTQAPADLTEFNGDELGADLPITAIGDRAFTQCANLVWVTIPETVTSIGVQAFENCTAMQGVLIAGTGSMTIGSDAFENCPEMRFLASNAMEMNLLDDYVPTVNSSYGGTVYSYLFAPTGGTGYPEVWGAFDPVMNVDTYVMERVGDSRILYGCDLPEKEGDFAEGEWIVIRAGKTLPEKVELTSECYWINIGAFAETQGETDAGFTINWNDIVPEGGEYWMILMNDAFWNSALAGEAAFPRGVMFYDECLKNCEKLERVNIGDYLEYMGKNVFVNDRSLKSVVLGRLDPTPLYEVALQDYQFNGCDSLETIEFPDMDPIMLSIIGQSDPYRFNADWTEEEETNRLRLIVSDWDKDTYLNEWKYTFAGYTWTKNGDDTITSAYDNMRTYIVRQNQSATTEEIDDLIAARVLSAENRLRTMLGMETVDQPTNLYNYEVDSDGMVTLTSVYTDDAFVWLDPTTVGLPDGWYLDYIGAGAFKHARNLVYLIAEDNLSGIYSGAFAGAPNSITLALMSSTPPELMVNMYEPFDFSGIDSVLLWDDDKTAYFESWKYPAAGFSNYDDLYWAVYSEIIWGPDFDPFGDIDYDELNRRIAERIPEIMAPYEEELRALLGIPEPEDGEKIEQPNTDVDESESGTEIEQPDGIESSTSDVDMQEQELDSETDAETPGEEIDAEESEPTGDIDQDVETPETDDVIDEPETDIEESAAASEEDAETKEESSAESEQSDSAEEDGEMTEEEP